MAKRIQFRRGSTTEHAAFVGAPGELTIDTTKKTVVVHDGITPGGFPASRLEAVDGTSTFNGQVRMTNASPSTSTTTGSLIVSGGVGVAGRITVSQVVETSTITVKENVNPILDALSSIMQLTGVIYDRKDKTSMNEPGLIAEEVNKILPNLVTKDDNGNPYGIQYTKLVAYLIEAVKDQQHQIEELKKKV
jgi:hypothetical protein